MRARTSLIALALLVAGGVALGFYQDWFRLSVNKEKMREDTEGAKERVRGLGQQAKDRAEQTADKAEDKAGTKGPGIIKTATGRAKKVEAGDNRFLMTTTDDKELTMYTGPSSKLRLNDQEVKLEDLQVKDDVKVAYDLQDGKSLATSVTANRKP
jgi:hypothetical protein